MRSQEFDVKFERESDAGTMIEGQQRENFHDDPRGHVSPMHLDKERVGGNATVTDPDHLPGPSKVILGNIICV